MDAFFTKQNTYFTYHIFNTEGIYFGIALFLCPVNWMLEALKWKTAVREMKALTFISALQSVVTGQALNLLFPASMGHCAGRLLHANVNGNDRLKVLASVFMCQSVQMTVTLSCCLVGFLTVGYSFVGFSGESYRNMLFCSLICILILVFIILKVRHFTWFQSFFQSLKSLKVRIIGVVFVLSFVRYATFMLQYILLFYFLGVSINWYLLGAMLSMVFMAKSMMPSIHFLSDLGIREFSALLFMPAIGLAEDTIIAASLWIWLINIMLPSVIGSFWLLRLKLNQLF